MKSEIKGILVTFFREGTKGDYLEALNKAQNELLTIMEASKISSNGMLKVTSDSTKNKKESEVAVAFAEWLFAQTDWRTKNFTELYEMFEKQKAKATDF